MILWGVNALNHGCSLAVFKDGKLQSNHSDKRDEIPSEMIVKALHYGAPDRLFWYEKPLLKKARQLYAGQWNRAFDLSVLPRRYMKGQHYAPITYTPHHGSHAAAGYYTSPFNHCAVVVLDAIGEFECATIWNCVHGEMKKVWSRSYPNSLGLFYSAFTDFIGLIPIQDEYQLQKMAEQGDPNRFLTYIRSYFNPGEVLEINTNFHRGVLHWDFNQLTTLQEQCDLAAAVQQVFEEQVQQVMATAKSITNADCLVYMGGCAMNSRANKNVVEPMWKHIWSLPNPGDPSSSVGAVLYHTKHRVWDFNFGVVKHIEVRV
jgi:carbamoyltransferase